MEKEHYLTEENVGEKVRSWLNEINNVKLHNPFKFNSQKSALLALDMQNVFLHPDFRAYIPSTALIIPRVNALIKKYKSYNLPIIFTKHISSSGDIKDTKRDLMKVWWRNPIDPRMAESQISSEMDFNDCLVIEKHQYSAFYETNLEEILIEKNITQLVITGVMTHLCCETTARDAFMRGFEVYFVIDGTASYTEYLHLSSLISIAHGFGKCLTYNEIIEKIAPNLNF